MDNPLAELVKDEVGRAESDYQAHRARAQAVLTVSGALVTALAGLLAVAVGKDAHLKLSTTTTVVAGLTLLAFVVATVFVLIIFLPRDVEWPDAAGLASNVEHDWEATGWEQRVAEALATYLISLRAANKTVTKLLALAILCQMLGVFGAAVLVLTIIDVA